MYRDASGISDAGRNDTVTKDWLAKTGLKFAEGPTDTGVIISWNTEGPANLETKNMTLAPGGLIINPINWKRDDTYAPATENLGSLNVEGKLVRQNVADRIAAFMK